MKYLMPIDYDFLKEKNYTFDEIKEMPNISFGKLYRYYSLCNALLTERDTVSFMNVFEKTKNNVETAKYVNENFDCIVISIGGVTNVKVLKNITSFLKLINIKIIVIDFGIVLRFKDDIKDIIGDKYKIKIINSFFKECLKRSNIIGVTDTDTGNILKEMGLNEDRDFYVCGISSFFTGMRGVVMGKNTLTINKNTKICVSRKNVTNHKTVFGNIYKKYKNSYTINFTTREYVDYFKGDNASLIKEMKNNKYVPYSDIEGVIDEVSKHDFFIGCNVSYNMIPLNINKHTLTLCSNKYDVSLCEHHKIPYVIKQDITEYDLNKVYKNCKYTLNDTLTQREQIMEKYLKFFELNDIKIDIKEVSHFKKLLCEKYKKELNVDLNIPEEYFIDEFKSGFYVSSKRKQVWGIELDIMNKIQKVCEKYNIKYYMDAGTLLGAVRHKGFVPWDDDIDIVMFHEDYDKFMSVAKEELYPFVPQDYHESPVIYNVKLRNSNTAFLNEQTLDAKYQFNQGLFVDVCRLDNVTDDEYEYRKFVRYLRIIKENANAMWKIWWEYERDNEEYKNKSFIEREKFEQLCRKYNKEETNAVAVLANPSGNPFKGQELRKYKDEFRNFMMMDFEILKMPAPIGYDSILTRLYGDYMTPSKSGGVHGKMYVDVNKSYKEYV